MCLAVSLLRPKAVWRPRSLIHRTAFTCLAGPAVHAGGRCAQKPNPDGRILTSWWSRSGRCGGAGCLAVQPGSLTVGQRTSAVSCCPRGSRGAGYAAVCSPGAFLPGHSGSRRLVNVFTLCLKGTVCSHTRQGEDLLKSIPMGMAMLGLFSLRKEKIVISGGAGAPREVCRTAPPLAALGITSAWP